MDIQNPHCYSHRMQGLPDPVEQDKGGNLNEGKRGAFSSGLDTFKQNLAAFGVDKPAERLQILQVGFVDGDVLWNNAPGKVP